MKKTDNEIKLLEGEEILFRIEGNAYTDSSNPLVKLLAGIVRLLLTIVGVRLVSFIVVTNSRIIRVDKRTSFWGRVLSDLTVSTLNKSSIQSVGYTVRIRWFSVRTTYFRLQNMTENLYIAEKDPKSNIIEKVHRINEMLGK